MHFALLGDHPDGLGMARALEASGRHQLLIYLGPSAGADALRKQGLAVRVVGDLEEILSDPAVEAVIIASGPGERAQQLRRSLQSERHVLCVYPPDSLPDIAHEAAMIQGDTHCVLLPLLPESLHPAFLRLAGLIRADSGPLGELSMVEVEHAAIGSVLLEAETGGRRPVVPGWDTLRLLGGEIVEVSAFATEETPAAEQPLLLAGRFEAGGLFQSRLLPSQGADWQRLTAFGSSGRAELAFGSGWPGPALLQWEDRTGEEWHESWDTFDPWPPMIELFEQALANHAPPRGLSWQTAVRSLELTEAVRRSLHRRRVSTLEYPEATEEVGFKGTMTLVGCALLWAILLLLILSYWFPWLRWGILPALALFLGMQFLRWLVPRTAQETPEAEDGRQTVS